MKRILWLMTLTASFSGIAYSQAAPPASKGQPAVDKRTSPFRYIIVSDATALQKIMNEGSGLHHVEVLMEDSAFNEQNLIKLSQLLGKRFTDRPGLYAKIFTSLDAIRTPEEYDVTDLGGLREDYRNYKYALFIRDGTGERLIYEIPGVKERDEIVLKPAPAPKNP